MDGTGPLLPAAPHEVLAWLDAGARRLVTALTRLDRDGARAPSHLPGWSRGHVVAHLAHNAEAFDAVTATALRGGAREVYPGGAQERDAAIERDATHPPQELRERLAVAQRTLHQRWRDLEPRGWDAPVPFRGGTVAHLLASRWREVEIHHADLDLGYTPEEWSDTFAEHAIRFLLPRLSDQATLTLDGSARWTVHPGGGEAPIEGPPYALAAWLAGRSAGRQLRCRGELPELGSWP